MDHNTAQTPENVIEVLGFQIPVSRTGRRGWSMAFKLEVGRLLETGEMTSKEIAAVCSVSEKTVYKWKNYPERSYARLRPADTQPVSNFQELRVIGGPAALDRQIDRILVRMGPVEVSLPANFGIPAIAQLVKEIGALS